MKLICTHGVSFDDECIECYVWALWIEMEDDKDADDDRNRPIDPE